MTSASPAPRPAAAEGPLPGVRVLDLADAAGSHCGRILADLGADVVKVEPPEGDLARRFGPFLGDRPGPERSLSWLSANANKRGITLSLATESGRDLFRRLVARADVLIETFPPGHLAGLGLDYDRLAQLNPRLIHTSITPYGRSGPLAGVPASDLEVSAAAGSLSLAGEPDRPPVRITLPQSPFWAGMHAAVGTLLAYLARTRTGRGQHVDVSIQAAVTTALPPAPLFWDLLGENPRRAGPYLTGRSIVGARFRNIWPCKDGYVTFALYGGPAGRHTNKMLTQWMASRGMAPDFMLEYDWDRFDVTQVSPEEVERFEAAIAPFFLTLTKREFFQGVIERNMLGYSVATAEDIYADPQLEARGFWQPLEVPEADRPLRFPGVFALFDGVRPPVRRPAPRIGEHNVEIYCGELGLAPQTLAALRGAGVV